MRNALAKLFLLFFLLSVGRSSVFAAVVINEIFPKSADVKQTWIELYNNGTESVSMDRWRLENTSDGTSFVLNASAIISPNGFLTLYQPQTNITFSIEGDTLRLFDEKNNLLDSQSYPGILGYNTSMGRTTDGAGSWTICTTPATPNKPNNCPLPTNTPTSIPTQPPSNTPTPSFSPASADISPASTPTPTSLFREAGQPAQSQVLGLSGQSTDQDSLNDSKESKTRRFLGIASLGIAGLAALGLLVRWYKRRQHR